MHTDHLIRPGIKSICLTVLSALYREVGQGVVLIVLLVEMASSAMVGQNVGSRATLADSERHRKKLREERDAAAELLSSAEAAREEVMEALEREKEVGD